MQIGKRKIFSPLSDDSGSVLAGVIAVFAVTIIIATVAATATVNASGFSSATRAGVQSLSSAEGGINIAIANMTSQSCQSQYTQGSVTGSDAGAQNLHFTTRVYHSQKAAGPWTAGCPVDAYDHFVRFVSTGMPEQSGVTQARGDKRTVEAVYNWSPAYSTTVIAPSGPAIYSSNGGLFSGSSQLKNPQGLDSVIDVAHGDAGCAFQTEGQSGIYVANIVVAEGSFATGGSCQIVGNVWAYNDLTTKQSAIIFGSTWSSSLDMSYSSSITKDSWVGGNTNMIESSTLYGHLTTASKSGPGVPGSMTVEPSLNGQKPTFPDGVKPVPPWIDYSYKKADWPNFAYTQLAAPCNPATMQGAINKMSINQPGPSMLDLTQCGADEISWDASILLPNDVAILTPNKFAVRGGGPAISTDGSPRRLWLIQTDDTLDQSPTCPTGGYLTLGDSYVVHDSVSTMVYTPCLLTLGQSAVWRGQFYAGSVTIAQSASLAYVPGGLPGADMNSGTFAPANSDGGSKTYTALMGDRVSIRDLETTN